MRTHDPHRARPLRLGPYIVARTLGRERPDVSSAGPPNLDVHWHSTRKLASSSLRVRSRLPFGDIGVFMWIVLVKPARVGVLRELRPAPSLSAGLPEFLFLSPPLRQTNPVALKALPMPRYWGRMRRCLRGILRLCIAFSHSVGLAGYTLPVVPRFLGVCRTILAFVAGRLAYGAQRKEGRKGQTEVRALQVLSTF
ncbi:hypothetical protein L227DRAFT_394662 [Lentinus tigrinus ALCF2SS1-6]|uniref:Uncharacterized protein n=1 Tax=Lentinus tigrinus ALCF2SS1-6 TaxID=1328759 RepID=A0A5C2SJW9_9APHY|nr:hypothetical protein L227DRAFT_394662 [Lentinus tigrinus ALCF2SS1-6]